MVEKPSSKTIGDWLIDLKEELGKGSFGSVYKA